MIFIPIVIAIIIVIIFYRHTIPQIENWKRYLLIFLRSIFLITVLILLFNPILYFIKEKMRKPNVIFLEDNSDSMKQTSENRSKTQAMVNYKKQLSNELKKKNYSILDYQFAKGLDGNTRSTNLTQTLNELSKNDILKETRSIMLFSDGWFKDKDLDVLSNLNIPMYSIYPDFHSTDFDLSISNLQYNKIAYKNETSPLLVYTKSKHFQGSASVKLIEDNKQLAIKQVDFSDKNFGVANFDIMFSRPGLHTFSVMIESDSLDEVNKANNTFSGALQVRNNKTKILILSDKLNWDVKFCIDIIKQNDRWEHQFLLMENKFVTSDIAASFNKVSLLLIVNNGKLILTESALDLVKSFDRKKGGIILFGKPIADLQSISPTTTRNIQTPFEASFDLTDHSNQYKSLDVLNAETLENIPPIKYFYVNPKIQSKVLAQIDNEENSPAIVLNSKGNFLHITFLNLWRWKLWNSESGYDKLITNIINWLEHKSAKRIVSSTDKNLYFSGEKIKVKMQVFDEKLNPVRSINAKLTIVDNKNKVVKETFMVEKNEAYISKLDINEPAEYRYKIEIEDADISSEGNFMINSENPENYDQNFNLPLLTYISKQTGGSLIDKDNLHNFTFPQANMIKKINKNEIPIYKNWIIIAVFLLSITFELYLRKRWGLL